LEFIERIWGRKRIWAEQATAPMGLLAEAQERLEAEVLKLPLYLKMWEERAKMTQV